MTDLLKGQNLQLRALEPEDLDLLYSWENDTDIWNISETLSPISRYLLKNFIKNSHKDIYESKQVRMIIQIIESSKAVGTIDLFNFDPFHSRAAIGILIAEKGQRRKGYASEALMIMLRYCFNVLKLHQVYCSVSAKNSASLNLFQQAGFVITGTRKSWNRVGETYEDEHFLQLIR